MVWPLTTTKTDSGFQVTTRERNEPLKLAMQRLWISGRILPAGARLMAHHVFRSDEKTPVEVVYAFALPRDGALRRFRVAGEGFQVHSELKPVAEARRQFEAGIQAGSLSILARLFRDGVVNLSLGNLRPGETVTVTLEILAGVEAHDDGIRFRFPFTLAPSYHAKARMVEVEPGAGEIALPEDEFGDVVLPRYLRETKDLHAVSFEMEVEWPGTIREIASPSHRVRVRQQNGRVRVLPAENTDAPDRDLVIDVVAAEAKPLLLGGADSSGKKRFAAFVPSAVFGERPSGPQRVAFVLDRSGSMHGTPIEQAKKAILACLGALSEKDQFGLVAFDDAVDSFRDGLLTGTKEHREEAARFLAGVDARGGTELAQGFLAAARILQGSGDVLVFTDGQVMGVEDILRKARQTGIRIHCLGIGSASQDRFLALLARETGGASRFLTPRERVDLPAVDLFASIGAPAATGLRIAGGTANPPPPSAVHSGTPVILFLEDPAGPLKLAWDGGEILLPEASGDRWTAETVRLLQGARLITDLESRYGAEGGRDAAEQREQARVAERLRALSQAYGLQSREMALVAVVSRQGDQPGEIPKTVVVPVGMPDSVRFSAYFGYMRFASTQMLNRSSEPLYSESEGMRVARRGRIPEASTPPSPATETPEDRLMELAGCLEPDGGMPGQNAPERVLSSVYALLAFLSHGHTSTAGAFRAHVKRLAKFLNQAATALSAEQAEIVRLVIERVEQGVPLPGAWLENTGTSFQSWDEIRRALQAEQTG
jgi:Ca-activated chloride channel family protein